MEVWAGATGKAVVTSRTAQIEVLWSLGHVCQGMSGVPD